MRGLKYFVVIATVGFFSCGSQEEEPKPSKWVGTYKVIEKHYSNDSFSFAEKTIYEIGSSPSLFINLHALNNNGTLVFKHVVNNTEDQISFFDAVVGPAKDSRGMLIDGIYQHIDTSISLYSKSQTSEVVRLIYQSTEQVTSRTPDNGYSTLDLGSYTKVNSNDHDCRKYSPPCSD